MTNKNQELKPCPFCGELLAYDTGIYYHPSKEKTGKECFLLFRIDVEKEGVMSDSREDQYWNTRPESIPISELEKLIKEHGKWLKYMAEESYSVDDFMKDLQNLIEKRRGNE